MNYKIRFPSGYQVSDPLNDNIDLNIFFPNGDVYFGTLVAAGNIPFLMEKNKEIYFWMTDMLIVKDLSRHTMRKAIGQVIEGEFFDKVFSKIGVIGVDVYTEYSSYDEIEDMAGTLYPQ